MTWFFFICHVLSPLTIELFVHIFCTFAFVPLSSKAGPSLHLALLLAE